MTPALAFGDDRSAEADICWSWIQSHNWDGWRLDVVTAEPHPDMTPVDPEEVVLHPWQPEEPRGSEGAGFVEVKHVRAEIDPRLALISESWDLVAVGPRGAGLLKGLQLGSTADWLLREPTSPLVIARRPEPVRSVVFAADGSIHARRALDTLIKLPWVKGLDVRVFTVDDRHTDCEAAQEEALSGLSDAGAEVQGDIHQGRPKRSILEEIERVGPDMVVMGARGVRGIKRLVVGSTAAAVVHSTDCTVLIAHAITDEV